MLLMGGKIERNIFRKHNPLSGFFLWVINECISKLMTALFIVIQNFVIVTQLNVTTYYIIKCNPIIRPHCIRHFIMRTVS